MKTLANIWMYTYVCVTGGKKANTLSVRVVRGKGVFRNRALSAVGRSVPKSDDETENANCPGFISEQLEGGLVSKQKLR